MIRLTIPSIEDDDLNAVREVLATGYLVQGARVAAFEESVASRVGTRYAVAVSSCTAALHLTLLALNVRPGDIVVVTAYSFVATANAIELCGALPVFVDIQPDTFNIDPSGLGLALDRLMAERDSACRVRAILPVHAFGHTADMPAIMQAAGRYSLPVIEDAACALGSETGGRRAGSWGKAGCFSFHPRKAVTTGEGGMITTDDERLVRDLKARRNHGQDPSTGTTDFIMPGFNYRLTEFQAALGLTQMSKLDRIIARRRELAENYDRLLAGMPVRPPARRGNRHVFQSYVLLLDPAYADRRTEIIAQLKAGGVESTIGTWHIPLTTYYRRKYGYQPGDFPNADLVFRSSLSLPMYESLTLEQQQEIVRLLQLVLDGQGSLRSHTGNPEVRRPL